MDKIRRKPIMNSGQVIPLFIVLLPAIIALIALVLDGGYLMLNRRQAQAAADAGALAGARELCHHSTPLTVVNTAVSYAIDNQASNASATIVNDEINVTAQIIRTSFFAKIFDVQNLEVTADAAAGCFTIPEAEHLLPISWSCKAPLGGSDSPDCQIFSLDWVSEMEPLATGSTNPVNIHNYGSVSTPLDFDENYLSKYLYIIVDANKVNDDIQSSCAPIGAMDCDLNNDGINEVFGGGDRSWLDLDGGGGGAADMNDWVEGGYDGQISIHTWLAGQAGVEASVYHTVEDLLEVVPPEFPVVMIPVFHGICDQNPDGKPECKISADAPDPVPDYEAVIASGGTSTTYFHIVGFSAFYITCVDTGGANKCPGAQAFVDQNPDYKNSKTIEGYFVSNYPFDLGDPGTGGVDVGVYIISLTK